MVKSIEQVREQLSKSEFDLTLHALRRLVQRDVTVAEIRQAGADARVIEEYPDDKYSPSCLLLGFTELGKPLHIQVSLADTTVVRIVTAYEPDPSNWIDFTIRR